MLATKSTPHRIIDSAFMISLIKMVQSYYLLTSFSFYLFSTSTNWFWSFRNISLTHSSLYFSTANLLPEGEVLVEMICSKELTTVMRLLANPLFSIISWLVISLRNNVLLAEMIIFAYSDVKSIKETEYTLNPKSENLKIRSLVSNTLSSNKCLHFFRLSPFNSTFIILTYV